MRGPVIRPGPAVFACRRTEANPDLTMSTVRKGIRPGGRCSCGMSGVRKRLPLLSPVLKCFQCVIEVRKSHGIEQTTGRGQRGFDRMPGL